jgi:aryl-alcohol dehydrogenase-like predicted oxidoreductase
MDGSTRRSAPVAPARPRRQTDLPCWFGRARFPGLSAVALAEAERAFASPADVAYDRPTRYGFGMATLRTLGPDKLPVFPIGLGCMGMSDFYGPRDDAQSIATIHRAVDLGVTLFDTADMYGPHTNERLVGAALAPYRDQVLIATKFGIVRDLVDPGRRTINGTPEYVRASCDGSLQRLGIDTIDLYYQHRVDQNTPIEETVGAMADLVRAGKVRYIGLSEAGSATIRRAHAVHPIAALQSEYSLWSRDIEDDIVGTCRELGITIVPYSPLGRGFLTGAIRRFEDFAEDDFRRRSPRFMGANFAKNLELVDAVAAMAQDKGCTPAQLALAWVLAQGDNLVPIPGTRSIERLEENVGAADVGLDDTDLSRLEAIAPRGIVAGERYTPDGMAFVGR